MEDMLRATAGNITEAMRTIAALNTKLNEANSALASWKMSIHGEVVSTKNGFILSLTVNKPNGQGFIKTISAEDIAYYLNDHESLVETVIEDIFVNLFKKQIYNEIAPVISRGLRNAYMMEQKS